MLFNRMKSQKAFSRVSHIVLARVCMAVGLAIVSTGLLQADGFDRTAQDTNGVTSGAPASRVSPAGFDRTPLPASPVNTRNRFESDPFYGRPENSRSRDPDRPVQPAGAKPKSKSSLSEIEMIHARLSSRYGNPLVVRFINNVSAERTLRLYREVSQLIDSRHLQPSSYAVRTHRGATNLWYAVNNPAFLRANRLSPSRNQVVGFRESLKRLMNSRPVHNSRDALEVVFATVNLASRELNLKTTTTILEFIYGATESLDKYSAFIPEENARRPSAALEDHIVGIGVEIKPHALGVLVVQTLRGSPATAAGLKGGDIIVSINGRSLEGQSLGYAADMIGGPAGSRIMLGIQRDGRRTSPVALIRRRVTIYSINHVRMIDTEAGVAYIKLDKFTKTSSDEMDRALWNLYRQGMSSLVIDLRGNPGGLLTTAIELSNKFVPCGSIVSTKGRNVQDNTAEYATYERTWKVPLVVLVDGNSASASEIFAAAIQENGRGLIVGRKSYGKGTVQTHFPLQSVAGNLRLTTARFYSPDGRVMANAGVTPDVMVASYETSGSTSQFAPNGDHDIEAAVAAVTSNQAREMAKANSGCRNPGEHDAPL